MTWHGPELDGDQRDVMALLDALAANRDVDLADSPALIGPLVTELAELGIWTIGASEQAGGGGATREVTAVALERLGRHWPALGWAAVQAHAAVELLAGDDRCSELVRRLHEGSAGVAVVDATADHVRLAWRGGSLTGTVDRVDAAAQAPYLLVLIAEDTALLVAPEATGATPLRRTGLAGAMTCSLTVSAEADALVVLRGVDTDAARIGLRTGVAAVAAGIAGAAADSAADYARARHQFGATLTAIPIVRRSLAEQAGRTAMLLAGVFAAARTPERSAALACAACDDAIEVAAAAVQSHGGYGYLAEYPAERRLRDAVSLRAAADTFGAAVTAAGIAVGFPPAVALVEEAS